VADDTTAAAASSQTTLLTPHGGLQLLNAQRPLATHADVDTGTSTSAVCTVDDVVYAIATRAPTVATTKENSGATRVPTTTDDASAGYAAGSKWFWPATGRRWICVSATAGAAVWEEQATQHRLVIPSGAWHGLYGVAAGNASGTLGTPDVCCAYPIYFPEVQAWQNLAFTLTTAKAGAKMYVGIADTGDTPASANILFCSREILLDGSDALGASGVLTLPITWTNPRPGLFWAFIFSKGVATAATVTTTTVSQQILPFATASTAIAGTFNRAWANFGAYPASQPTSLPSSGSFSATNMLAFALQAT
jgi:hypothetical protein